MFSPVRAHTVAEFHRRLRTVARKYSPHFMISGNVFGGFGYGHVLWTFAGDLEEAGVGAEDIRRMLVDNPRRIFARVA